MDSFQGGEHQKVTHTADSDLICHLGLISAISVRVLPASIAQRKEGRAHFNIVELMSRMTIPASEGEEEGASGDNKGRRCCPTDRPPAE